MEKKPLLEAKNDVVFKTLFSLNSDYLINKIESTNKIKSNKEYIIGSIDKNGIITIILN